MLKVRQKIKSKTKLINQNIQISVSAGVAVGAVSWMALLEKADKSLFKAKARGKNAVDG